MYKVIFNVSLLKKKSYIFYQILAFGIKATTGPKVKKNSSSLQQ